MSATGAKVLSGRPTVCCILWFWDHFLGHYFTEVSCTVVIGFHSGYVILDSFLGHYFTEVSRRVFNRVS